MGKKSKKSSNYIKIAVLILIVILAYFFLSSNKNHYNTYKLRNTAKSGEPIKLQFRNGFQYDHYKPAKKSTFMQKRMENKDGSKKPIFWDKNKD